ncbi:MAG: hypothetical protein KC645_19045 [Gemmatimonadetes bacterium]|nr:hypothetical protein [Gemmatimonadota bacterium]
MVPLLLLALLGVPPGGPRQEAPRVCAVARPGALDVAPDPELLRRIFLLRQRSWPDGTRAHPVNLPASSPLRERFSRAVLGESVQALAAYWNDRYFHGTRPPPTMASEEAVLLFVERTSGAVGYVAEARTRGLPADVRVLGCF